MLKHWSYILLIISSLSFLTEGNKAMGKSLFFKALPTGEQLRSSQIKKVILDSGKIYLATSVGLSISEDDGKTFKTLTQSDGLPNNSVEDMLLVDGDIYVRSYNAFPLSVMRKGEQTFTELGQKDKILSLVNDKFESAAQSMSAEVEKYRARMTENVPVGSVTHDGNRVFLATYGGIYVSKDNGKSFQVFASGIGLPSNDVTSLQAKNGKIYAGTTSGFVILSEDEDVSHYLLSPDGRSADINQMLIDNGRLFVSTSHGFRYSKDGGKSFTSLDEKNGLASNTVSQFFIRGKDWYLMAGGFFVSHDDGASFEHFSSEDYKFHKGYSDALFIDEKNHWYISDDSGYSVSKDQGANFEWIDIKKWVPKSEPETSYKVHAILKSRDSLFIGVDSGLLHTSDEGKTFTFFGTNNGIGTRGVKQIRESEGKIYVGTYDALSVSSDQGKTFKKFSGIPSKLNLENFYVEKQVIYVQRYYYGSTALKVNGLALDKLWQSEYHGIYVHEGKLYLDNRKGVEVLGIQGKPLHKYYSSGMGELDVQGIAALGNQIFVGTGRGLFISGDAGKTFQKYEFPTERSSHNVNYVHADPKRIVIGTSDDLQVSEDQGSTFKPYPIPYVPLELEHAPEGEPDFGNHVNTAYLTGEHILVGTGRGFAASHDNGKTFQFLKFAQGVPSVSDIQGFGQKAVLATTFGIFLYDLKSHALTPFKIKDIDAKWYNAVAMSEKYIYCGTDKDLVITDYSGKILSQTKMERVSHISLSGDKLYTSNTKGLSVSTDNGKTFKTYGTESGRWYPFSTVHLVNDHRIYVGARGLFAADEP